MKIYNTFLFLIVFTLFSCKKNERPEVTHFVCTENSLKELGMEMSEVLDNFESHLIAEGVLRDDSGASYKAVYENIAAGEDIEFEPSGDYLKMMRIRRQADQEILKECENKVVETDAYKNSKITLLKTALDSILMKRELGFESFAKAILTVLDEEDMEMDYYRFRTFEIINAMNTRGGAFKRQEPEAIPDDALIIDINAQNELFIKDNSVSDSQLPKKIKEYVKSNTSSSLIFIKADDNSLYEKYVSIQNIAVTAVNGLRDELAMELFDKKFDDLSQEDNQQVYNIYPKNIVKALRKQDNP